MGNHYKEKCDQINHLVELYDKHQKADSAFDRMNVLNEIFNALKEIKEWEEKWGDDYVII